MEKQDSHRAPQSLPPCAAEYIAQVVRKVRYRKKVRRDIEAELTAHFEDELRDCTTDAEREAKTRQLIEEFGDPKLLAVLCRRAKKRCRPLWAKVLGRGVQACGVFLLYVVGCVVPMFFGRPTIRTNYIQVLNDTVRAGRQESDNARPYYDRAAELRVPMPDWLVLRRWDESGDFKDSQWGLLGDWLRQNASALDALREGSRRDDYWRAYLIEPNEVPSDSTGWLNTQGALIDETMPILANWRQLAFTLRWRIYYEVHNGQVDAAIADCLVLSRFGDHLLGAGSLVELLVAFAVGTMADNSLITVLDRTAANPTSLAGIQEEWRRRFEGGMPPVTCNWEKTLCRGLIQCTFTDDGKGDGHLLVRGAPLRLGGEAAKVLWTIVTFRSPSRRRVVSDMERYYLQADELFAKTPWELHCEGLTSHNWDKSLYADSLLWIQSDSCWNVAQWNRVWRTYRIASLTILSLKRYRMERGQYPADLEKLVDAGYLREVPSDPFGPGSLSYRRINDDFLLYSWGKNFQDDGGKPGVGYKGQPATWVDNGDWVFWPIVRSQK